VADAGREAGVVLDARHALVADGGGDGGLGRDATDAGLHGVPAPQPPAAAAPALAAARHRRDAGLLDALRGQVRRGGRVLPHSHTGPVFGYVLEGEYEHALDDEPVTTYKAGDTFYEPSGCVHRVTRNPSARAKTRLLAVILHPRDAEKVTVPEEAAKRD
jgi:Cupin domain